MADETPQLPVPYEQPIEGEFVGKDQEKRAYYKRAYGGRMSDDDMVDTMRYALEMWDWLVFFGHHNVKKGAYQPKEERVLFIPGDRIQVRGDTGHLGDMFVVGIDPAADEDVTVMSLYGVRPGPLYIYDDVIPPLPKEEPLFGKAKHTAELNKMRAKMRGKRRW